jgi:sugar phosphate isomerase/epimerase
MIALSSMWAVNRFGTLPQFAEAARSMGFPAVELNYQAPPQWIANAPADVVVRSVHAPCPWVIRPDGRSGYDVPFNAWDDAERREAVRLVKGSIDAAHALGAKAVVLHLGTIQPDEPLEEALWRLHEKGQFGTPEYDDLRARLEAQRRETVGPWFERVHRSLKEIVPYAEEHEIVLGLETRYHYLEIPDPDEMADLLAAFSTPAVGYWHDVGHAENMARLGFWPHEHWLNRFASRLVGMHLHDVVGLVDHRAAGLGTVDWETLRSAILRAPFVTCEFGPANTPKEVHQGLQFLIGRGLVSA